MNAIPADTTVEAAVRQFQALRRLETAERAEMTFELSDNIRQVVEAGLRQRHPEYDEKMIARAALRLAISPELFREADIQI